MHTVSLHVLHPSLHAPHSFPTRRSSDLLFGMHDFVQLSGQQPIDLGDASVDSGLHVLAHHQLSLHYLLNKLRSEEHTSELQSRENLVCRLLPEKQKNRCFHSSRTSTRLH